jgi:hypothetical protein
MAKKKSKQKEDKIVPSDDAARLKVLQDKLKEIQARPQVMSSEEQKIVNETKIEINQIKNK